MIVVLENIRSAYNVGSIFRTSDAFGISKLFLVGVTPLPIDKFGREQKEIAKTALGAEKNIAWESRKLIKPLLNSFIKDGYTIISLEQDAKSSDIKSLAKIDNSKIVLILGNEVHGVSKSAKKMSHLILEIPMLGKKESLNVSVAYGIASYLLSR